MLDFSIISAYTILAPLIVGAFLFRSLLFPSKILYSLVIVTAFIELSAYFLYLQKMNNMFINHVQSTAEFYLLSIIYLWLLRSVRITNITVIFMILFGLFTIYSILFIEGLNEFNAVQRWVEMILLTQVVLLYMREQSIRRSTVQMKKNPFFWLSVGYLIYFTGTIYLFVNQKYFLEIGQTEYWIIHGIFNIFLNSVFTFVLWTGRAQSLS